MAPSVKWPRASTAAVLVVLAALTPALIFGALARDVRVIVVILIAFVSSAVLGAVLRAFDALPDVNEPPVGGRHEDPEPQDEGRVPVCPACGTRHDLDCPWCWGGS